MGTAFHHGKFTLLPVALRQDPKKIAEVYRSNNWETQKYPKYELVFEMVELIGYRDMRVFSANFVARRIGLDGQHREINNLCFDFGVKFIKDTKRGLFSMGVDMKRERRGDGGSVTTKLLLDVDGSVPKELFAIVLGTKKSPKEILVRVSNILIDRLELDGAIILSVHDDRALKEDIIVMKSDIVRETSLLA
jgi:hypothetical protein